MAFQPAPALRVPPKVRRELTSLMKKPTAPQRAILRARILLDAADGFSNTAIAERVGMARQNVIAVRQRYEERGLESVLRDAPGRGRPKTISEAKIQKIVEATLHTTPKNATHWSSRELAKRHR